MSLDYFAWRRRLATVRQQYGLYQCFQVWEVHGEDPVDRKYSRNPQPIFTEVTVHRLEMEKGQKPLSLVLILL